MNVLIGLFWRYGLVPNVIKYHTMIYQSDVLRSGISEDYREHKCMGLGDSYHDRLWQNMPCPE